ncbi:MAG TPA: hypothetical protein PL018_12345 [Ignavibacteriaceae bacterium]|nr:hypothetical protein [Ignavibacteriaceae bacterium]
MKQKFVKVVTEEGSAYYHRSRYLTLHSVMQFPGRYIFKDNTGQVVEPTDLELELYNEMQSGGIKVSNGWLTLIGSVNNSV